MHYAATIELIDKTLLFNGGSIGWQFLLVNGYFPFILHQKAGVGDAIWSGRWIGCRSFEKSAHILVESPGWTAFLSPFQPYLSAIEVAVDNLLDIRPPALRQAQDVLPGEILVIGPDKGLKIVLDAAVVIRILRISWTINGGRSGHDFSP